MIIYAQYTVGEIGLNALKANIFEDSLVPTFFFNDMSNSGLKVTAPCLHSSWSIRSRTHYVRHPFKKTLATRPCRFFDKKTIFFNRRLRREFDERVVVGLGRRHTLCMPHVGDLSAPLFEVAVRRYVVCGVVGTSPE